MSDLMDRERHWQGIYGSTPPTAVGWYAPHLDRSLAMIRAVAALDAEIIDVGGGASTLVDDLLALGYRRISVLDVSATALDVAQQRLGSAARTVAWLTADITRADLPPDRYDVWHDRAVFHFLTEASDRQAYADVARRSLKRGGYLIMATFAPEGPRRCSGLDVVRYDARRLVSELGPGFAVKQDVQESHVTPGGAEQKFLYCLLQKAA